LPLNTLVALDVAVDEIDVLAVDVGVVVTVDVLGAVVTDDVALVVGVVISHPV
jgi:hypothetical protein